MSYCDSLYADRKFPVERGEIIDSRGGEGDFRSKATEQWEGLELAHSGGFGFNESIDSSSVIMVPSPRFTSETYGMLKTHCFAWLPPRPVKLQGPSWGPHTGVLWELPLCLLAPGEGVGGWRCVELVQAVWSAWWKKLGEGLSVLFFSEVRSNIISSKVGRRGRVWWVKLSPPLNKNGVLFVH